MLIAIQNALSQKGFEISDSENKRAAQLTVELRGLRYGWETELFGGTLKTECTIKANGRTSKGNFEQVYRVEKDADTNWTPTAEYNEKLVNAILSDALSKMLNDNELLSFLSSSRTK